MGMSSSRRYGMQEITMVTTSTDSDWQVYFAKSQSAIKWCALGNVYQGEKPIIDFSGNVGSENITVKSIKGLTYLWCTRRQLTELDVSKNVALVTLKCSINELKVLDVSKNISLTHLKCPGNKLNKLDVSKNISLTHLECHYNQLNKLDVSKNISLTILECRQNPGITELDVSKNVALVGLYCFGTLNLTTVYVNQTQLDKLNGVIPSDLNWNKDAHTQYVLKQ